MKPRPSSTSVQTLAPTRDVLRLVEVHQGASVDEASTAAPQPPLAPHWDSSRRQLTWGSTLVKQFRKTAPAQEAILTAFQEQGWPERIETPLQADTDELLELVKDTIKNLNRNVKPFLKFHQETAGRWLRWEALA